jgi:hypothetical protein
MKHNMSDSDYHPTDEDIRSALHYLRVHLPEYGTPENALKLLNQMHGHYKSLEEMYPEEIEKILQDLEEA